MSYHKLDIARYLQNWQQKEQTLPPPFSKDGNNGGRLLNRNIFSIYQPLDSWAQTIDSDQDGLPDNWETRWFPKTAVPATGALASGDDDKDGIKNLDEYRLGQDPTNPPKSNDLNGDHLDDDWEIRNGYNPWDGESHAGEDPDRDGLTNLQEATATGTKSATDPFVANPGEIIRELRAARASPQFLFRSHPPQTDRISASG